MQTVRMWLAKGSFGVFVYASYNYSFATAAFKLGWFLYTCLPKAVGPVKQGVENEWLK